MHRYAPLTIRIGLTFVLFWFGVQQISNPGMWIGFVPNAVVELSTLSAQTIVLINGSLELVFGMLLLLGVYTRVVAGLLALHLASIAIVLGNTPSGVRDWGLATACLSLVFSGPGFASIDLPNSTQKNTP